MGRVAQQSYIAVFEEAFRRRESLDHSSYLTLHSLYIFLLFSLFRNLSMDKATRVSLYYLFIV